MIIKLSPQRRDETLALSKNGAVLTINGEAFDFSRMVNGDTLPAAAISSPWFTGEVHCLDGELEVTLILPLPGNYSPEQAFPQPLVINSDGPVIMPGPLREPDRIETVGYGEPTE